VQGVSEVGAGAASAVSVAVVPFTFPDAPQLTAATPGNRTIEVSWTAGGDGGSALTGFTATTSPGGLSCTAAPDATSCTIESLTNGTGYTVSVYGTNAGGDGAVAAWPTPVTPRTVPGAPRTPSVTAGDRSLVVRWLAPTSTGGAAVTSYRATATPGGAFCDAAAPAVTCTILSLTNGQNYSVSVVATNAAGDSLATDGVSGSPVAVPGRPSIIDAELGDGSVTLAWRAPTSDGGASITEYRVTGTPGGACTWTSGPLSCEMSSLANGTSYSFTVRARNVAGFGQDSVAYAATPRTTPGAPRAVTVVEQDSAMLVSWTAPLDNGGAAVTGYVVTASPGGATCEAEPGEF